MTIGRSLAAVALAALACGPALAAETTRISVSSGGGQADGDSQKSSISFDGRYVAFSSRATNLVSGDGNGAFDVFVHDNDTDETARVSRGRGGAEANGASYRPAISGDGRFVAFTSTASNLVEGDTNGKADVFVFDRRTETTERVSVADGGGEGDGPSDFAAISADGRRVAFQTDATNLFPEDENKLSDILMRDRAAGTTTLISKSSNGVPNEGQNMTPAISADGRYVVFWGDSQGDFRVYAVLRHDTVTGRTECVEVMGPRRCMESLPQFSPTAVSADGRFVAVQRFIDGDTGTDETYVSGVVAVDMKTGEERIVSRPASGDLANYDSYRPTISADGRYVAFTSGASNLVPGDTNKKWDVFVTDRLSGAVTRVNVGGKSRQASLYSDLASITADGRIVTFSSQAPQLVDGDTNGAFDVFMRDLDAEPGKKADMRVEARSAPRKVRRGERTTFSFVATNFGPDAATAASFSLRVENGRLKSASSKLGDCRTLGGFVSCDLGKLAPRKSVLIKAEVVAEDQPLRQSARVQAGPVDPEKADNSLTVTSKVAN
ncbi:hypothetical protein [Chenggangzhangella methanolivorans]|uniref:DUF11 domain-containing protein n=1 Tax=Chenggangzhangella methanolivorans TaxID=1437009 RepID=A0A9E6R8C3_9HYPH|nr:hypothetical protein [Chenggangzhangella methanolivorans]QZN98688.1 DUF11 domain-containing protein [Chenggangzhangella methanolivorans]